MYQFQPFLEFAAVSYSKLLLAATLVLYSVASVAAGNVKLARAAVERTLAKVTYDGSYRSIDYPGGDVPDHIGVCTDLVIRSYRTLNVDLQVLVHEDIRSNFDAYPEIWGLTKPDPNIDHRRVPNLETFFERNGRSFEPSTNAGQYAPGDIVSWRLTNALPHIGVVSPNKVPGTDRHFVIHNIGRGPKEEDVLFRYALHGHYRFLSSGNQLLPDSN